ncbi:MAG: response regulator [Comamonas sp.]
MISYLYVEDDADIREGVAMVMEAEYREIVSLPHAEAALALADLARFDVLITDISLPGISGMDLAKHWLAHDPGRHVLLLSGYEFTHGLGTIGPNVRALLKSAEPEELEAALLSIESALPARMA